VETEHVGDHSQYKSTWFARASILQCMEDSRRAKAGAALNSRLKEEAQLLL